MRPRIAERWKTRFGSFVSRYTVTGILSDLAIAGQPTNAKTVYSWLAGRSAPRPARLEALVLLSRGAITPADVLSHRREVGDGSQSGMAGGAQERHRRD